MKNLHKEYSLFGKNIVSLALELLQRFEVIYNSLDIKNSFVV